MNLKVPAWSTKSFAVVLPGSVTLKMSVQDLNLSRHDSYPHQENRKTYLEFLRCYTSG